LDEQPQEEISKEERPKTGTLTSHGGVDLDEGLASLKDPPTELHNDSHPESHGDGRYRETLSVAEGVKTESSGLAGVTNTELKNLELGETTRQKDAAESISKTQRDSDSNAPKTILIVEDNIINQKVLRRQLQARGFEVFVASNGQEAVDIVEERGKIAQISSNRRNYFDCILMDQGT